MQYNAQAAKYLFSVLLDRKRNFSIVIICYFSDNMFSASKILIHFSQKLQKPICGNLKIQCKALSTAFHNHGK